MKTDFISTCLEMHRVHPFHLYIDWPMVLVFVPYRAA